MAAPAGITPVFTIRGPLVRSDLPGLCGRLQTLLAENEAAVALCNVDSCVEADLVAIDTLARLQLDARRNGHSVRLNRASADVHQLLAFVGLDEELGVETSRQPEQWEELLGVEEERELDDPTV